MKIELDDKQLGEIASQTIANLEKQVRSLENKLRTRDNKIKKLQSGMDLTRDTRERIRGLADALSDELKSAGMVDDYYD